MLPVREARHHDAVQIGEDGVEASGRFGRIGGQGRLDFARRGPRHHRVLRDIGAIVGDAIDDLVAPDGEILQDSYILITITSEPEGWQLALLVRNRLNPLWPVIS